MLIGQTSAAKMSEVRANSAAEIGITDAGYERFQSHLISSYRCSSSIQYRQPLRQVLIL